ncbi:MAG: serine--tRNA ligase [Pseudomonadota bacterium]|nr:serine--tRNA ligase [Pseudomonadota bacterium]
MHDLKAIRTDPEGFDRDLARRGLPGRAEAILTLDAERRAALTTMQEGQAQRNALSKQIGQAKRTGGDSVALEAEATALRERMVALESDAARHEASIKVMLDVLPNRLDPAVPDGADESGNVVVKQVGEPRQLVDAKEHFELGEALGMMDFEAAARMSGARFTILRGKLARMERALGQFMLDVHTGEHGYTEMQVPLLVNDDAAYGTDKLPKFADDLFKTTDGRWLIPTSEVPLTSMVLGQIVPEAELPMRMTALSECFRSEAGSAGRDTRGMLRQHQFRKVELVSITAPEQSEAEHERMTVCAEAVLEKLGLAYRRMLLCAGDTGFGAAKTFDLEVWLPGQKAWREISSCSNTRDFQARRMNARMRGPDGKVAGPVHTLNGSGVALGRCLIAVMETYQQQGGAIAVPEVLVGYMGGVTTVE